MALVQAPALSLEASGSLGGAIVFSKWKGRPYVRALVTPSNPKSPMQTGVRSMMKALSKLWNPLGDVPKATWDALAAATNISPFNAFIGYNMARWRMGLGVATSYPAAETVTPGAITSATCTGGSRHTTLAITATKATHDLLWLICRSLVTGFTPTWANAVIVVAATTDPTIIDSPLDPETYYYRIARMGDDGKIGAFLAEIDGTVT